MVFGFDSVWAAIGRELCRSEITVHTYIHVCIHAKFVYMYRDSWTVGEAKLAGCGCRARVCEAPLATAVI